MFKDLRLCFPKGMDGAGKNVSSQQMAVQICLKVKWPRREG